MYKSILLLTSLLFIKYSFSQTNRFQALLDSGKAAFKEQAAAQTSDYTHPFEILKQAVALQPDNAEARYFLGYTIDRLNANDGSTMYLVKKDLTLKASEQFEKVIATQKTYEGEMLFLDPYSKITSIWGSLAQAYLVNNLADSAMWAFKEGKQRGGFIEPILEYNRQLLRSCRKNAILVTNGDLITIPLWYLQTVEKFRTDVTIVDANLVNTGWYTKYLKNNQGLHMSLTDTEIDTINYIAWEPTTISVHNPNNTSQTLSWVLKPTYYDQYILKGDRILLDIVKQNLFTRTFYFSRGSDSTTNLYLHDYLIDDGIVDRLIYFKNDSTTKTTIISKNLDTYNIDKLKAKDIKQSQDAIYLLNIFRLAFTSNSEFLYSKGEIQDAKRIFLQMKQKFDTSKLPYESSYIQDKVTALEKIFK